MEHYTYIKQPSIPSLLRQHCQSQRNCSWDEVISMCLTFSWWSQAREFKNKGKCCYRCSKAEITKLEICQEIKTMMVVNLFLLTENPSTSTAELCFVFCLWLKLKITIGYSASVKNLWRLFATVSSGSCILFPEVSLYIWGKGHCSACRPWTHHQDINCCHL